MSDETDQAFDSDYWTNAYVKIREEIKRLDDAHKEVMRPHRERLEKLNSFLLNRLNDLGCDSIRSSSGTIYRTERKTASLADADAFMQFVIANQAFDLLDRKANTTAVSEFIATHNAPPPGVNFSTTYLVGVRRGTNDNKE
jgi:hypothetical protein